MNERLSAAIVWLRAQQAEMERMLALLVGENSHTENRAGADRVAAMLREFYTLPNLVIAREPCEGFGEHVVAASSACGTKDDVLLIGHHDTVFPPGTFEGYRTEGALARGPGVLDMKGGLVVVRFALAALAEAGLLEKMPVKFISVSDEEVGSPSSQAVIRRLAGSASSALVFEPGRAGDAVVTSRKGTGQATVSAKGRAAHAGARHHEGKNAIWALALFIDKAQRLTDYARGVTINVGKIEGGHGKNVVPDQARAFLDLRFVDPKDGPDLIERLTALAEASAREVEGTSIAVEAEVSRPPLVRNEKSLALYAEYAASAKGAGLAAVEAPISGGGSDANTVSAVGVAAIDGLGPRGDGFHTLDEHIERATLIPKAEALVRFLAARFG